MVIITFVQNAERVTPSATRNERVVAARFCAPNNLSRSNLDMQHIDEKGQEDNSQLLDAQADDRKESDFVGYSWANVGSFDDLDKILRHVHDSFERMLAIIKGLDRG
nr:protein LNK2 isoform X2 [Tanacetum cinerariifolium]